MLSTSELSFPEVYKYSTHSEIQHLSLCYDGRGAPRLKIVQSYMPVARLIILICILIEPPLPESEEAEKQDSFEGNTPIRLINVPQKVYFKNQQVLLRKKDLTLQNRTDRSNFLNITNQ